MPSRSAVAKRPRDASCLSVVSFNSTIPQAQFLLGLYYTSASDLPAAYNSIMFCCLRRNVQPCCHTHEWRVTSTATMYSARPRLVDLALYTATRWSRLVVQYPRLTKSRPQSAKYKLRRSSYWLQGQIIIDFDNLAYPTCIRRSR